MPRPTAAPLVLALGMALLAAGVAIEPGVPRRRRAWSLVVGPGPLDRRSCCRAAGTSTSRWSSRRGAPAR